MTTCPLPPVADPRAVALAIARLPPGSVVATDADETLWAADVGDEVVRAAAAGVAPWLAGAADFDAYAAQMAHGDYAAACRACAVLLAAVDPALAERALDPVLRAVRPRRWLAEALEAAAFRGVRVWVVSASPRPVVAWALARHRLPAAGVIGIEVDSGEVEEPAPVGEGKVAAWRARGLPPPALALGDSVWDGPLIASAAEGFLLAKASADPWRAAPLAALCDASAAV